MRWFHILKNDYEKMEPRTGLFIYQEREPKKFVVINLVLAYTGAKERLFFVDYDDGVLMARPRWWMRLECVWGRWRPYFYYCAGLSPLLLGELVEKRPLTLYEQS